MNWFIKVMAFAMLVVLPNSYASNNSKALLPEIKALALDKLVVDRSGEPITVLETPVILDSTGNVAKGLTEVTITLDDDATNGLVINGTTIEPGESIKVIQNLSITGGVVKIPAYPSVSNIAGVTGYNLDIPKVTAKVCDDSFDADEETNTCKKVHIANLTYICPNAEWVKTGDLTNCTQTSQIAKAKCPEGFESNGDGTCTKIDILPTVPQCEEGYSYSTVNKRCEKTLTESAQKVCSDPTYTYQLATNDCRKILTQPVNYVCQDGYVYNSSNKKCERTLNENADAVCLAGYTYSTANQRCEKTLSQPASKVCSSGYIFSEVNNRCEKTLSQGATPTCREGFTYNSGSKRCEKTESLAAEKECGTGYTLSADKTRCEKTLTQGASAVCASGYTYNNSQKRCEKTITQNASKVCSGGYQFNAVTNRCEKTLTQSASAVCASGFTYNSTNKRCEKTISQVASKVCATGYTYSSANDRCEKMLSQGASPVCSSGFSYNSGTKRCEKTLSQAANKVCAPGYAYISSRNRCEKTITVAGTPVCASGYTYSSANKRCEKTVSQAASKVCGSGYTYVSSTNRCEKRVSQGATPVCPAGYVYSSANKRCEKTLSQNASKVCGSGYSYNASSNRCEKKESKSPICSIGYTYNASANKCQRIGTVSPNCPSGKELSQVDGKCYTRSGDNACFDYEYQDGNGSCRFLVPSNQCECGYKTLKSLCPAGTKPVNSGGECVVGSGANTAKCPSGFTMDGKVCKKTISISASCETGFTLNTSTDKCEKILTQNFTYSCPSGYTLSGSTCRKLTVVGNTWSCPSGYTLSGSTCSKLLTQAFTYRCPNGFTLSGSTCRQLQTANNTWSCPSGYTLNGSTCSKLLTQSFSYSCPNGYTLSGSTCSQLQTAVNTWSCPAGYTLSGATCRKLVTQGFTYSCPSGFVNHNNGNCTQLQTAANTWRCPSDYVLSGSTCSKLVTQAFTYSCPSGFVNHNNGSCSQLQTVANTWTCPKDYTLDGVRCNKLVTQGLTYVCPSNYVNHNNGTCSLLQTAANNWSCPTGYTLSGSTCNKVLTQNFTYSCPANYVNHDNGSCTLLQTAANTWVCPEDFTNHGNGRCSLYQSNAYSLSCSDNTYHPNTTTEICEKVLTAGHTYKCSNPQYILNGSSCNLTLTAEESWICGDADFDKNSETECSKETSTMLTGSCPAKFTKSENGKLCSYTDNANKITSCPASYSLVNNSCIKETFEIPECPTSIIDSSCSCPAGMTLNNSTLLCEGESTVNVIKTCPVGYSKVGSECVYEITVPVIYDFCPVGTETVGNKCQLTQTIGSTPICSAPYGVDGKQCAYTEVRPIGYVDGVEARYFTGKFTTELSTIKFENTSFDAVVSQVSETALDEVGGCRLVPDIRKAQGTILEGNVPCAVKWQSLPEGITGDEDEIKGVFNTSGQQSIGYSLVGFNGPELNEFEISHGEIVIDVTEPAKPVITDIQTRLMNKTVSGFEMFNYSPLSTLSLTSVIVEPRDYVQAIEIVGVGECEVPENSTSCNVFTNIQFELDENELQKDTRYQVYANSRVGGWDKAELEPTEWIIHHDFRGPNVVFADFNPLTDAEDLINSELGFPVSIEGGSGAVGITNIRGEVSDEDAWWKPARVDLVFTALDGSQSTNTVTIDDLDIIFDMPNNIVDKMEVKSSDTVTGQNGRAYLFDMMRITSGMYNVQVKAKDSFNNESIATYENIEIKKTRPQIKVIHKRTSIEKLSSAQNINMLDDVMVVAHNGILGDTTITSLKIDGKEALASNNDPHFKKLTGEGFDIAANSTYLMEITAQDSSGETTSLSLKFDYLRMKFALSRQPVTVIQKVEDIALSVNRTQGLNCELYGTKAAAALEATDYKYTCYIEWTELPDGLIPEVTTYQSKLTGAVTKLGTNNLSYTAYTVNKMGRSAKVGSESITFEAVAPLPLTIKLDEKQLLKDGVYSVSVNDRALGRYTGESSRADIKVELSNAKGESKLFKHNQLPFGEVQSFSAYAERLGDSQLWDKVSYKLEAAYVLAPELNAKQEFDLIVTPHPYMQVLMELDSTKYASTDQISATINLGLRNNATGQFEYDSATMGSGWDVFLAFKKGDEYEAITEVVQSSNGTANLTLDANIIFERNNAVYAVANARSPYPEINIQRVSIPRSITVVKGTAIEGEVVSRVVHSRIPANFDLRFDTASMSDLMVLGDIDWQFKDSTGAWVTNSEFSNKQYISVKSNEPETIDVRAAVENKVTGAMTYSDEVTLISYDVPAMKIEGSGQAISGQTIELTALDHSTTPQADTITEWSMDNGKTWEAGSANHSVIAGDVTMKVYGRMKYANTSLDVETGYWSQAIKYISVTKPKPLSMFVNKPSLAEVGKEILLKMQVSNPFAATGLDVKYEWQLPDGSIVKDVSEITYLVEEMDLDDASRVVMTARAWLDGYKDGTMSEVNVVINTFSYTFPSENDLSLTVNNNIKYVPSTGFATLNMPYINAPGVVFTYDWSFDEEAISKTTGVGKSMNFTVNKSGVHKITITLSDNRGNFAQVDGFVDAIDPEPLSFKVNDVYSNKYMRAPLTVSLYPSVSFSHPYDFIKEYVWSINGEEGEPTSRAIGVFESLPVGTHNVELTVTSNFGQTGKYSTSFDVKANQVPVCEPSVRKQYGVHIVDANCKDSDGTISFYEWTVNGVVFSPYGSQVRFTEQDFPSANIVIQAVDDAGGKGIGHISF